MNLALLDNITWHSLNGPHARFAVGGDTARRYAPGFSPILGFADRTQPDWDALAAFCEPGEHLYSSGWSCPLPAGWSLDVDTRMHQMVWAGAAPEAAPADDLVELGAPHLAQMLELVAQTQPGPFGPRTPELGRYLGVFDGERLVAMAGERMTAGTLVEVSGVCTAPSAQGRGLARRLMLALVREQLARGATPFLHVMVDNLRAHGLYRRMGFAMNQTLPVRVVSRSA
jgi:ribosomal protein S18 acetylase RimI-like enzyme